MSVQLSRPAGELQKAPRTIPHIRYAVRFSGSIAVLRLACASEDLAHSPDPCGAIKRLAGAGLLKKAIEFAEAQLKSDREVVSLVGS